MKKLIALLLTLAMLLSIVPAAAAASFTDVKAGAFYAEAVDWAVANGVTAGTSATTFSPDNTCSRGEVVTFLWRAMGKPAPSNTDNPFSDVPEGRFYTTPVLWALEQGVTSGTSATTFTPDKACTRGEVVTFLWRAMGKPTPTTTDIPFSDVTEGRFYAQAVLWAVENNITTGIGNGKFGPDLTCTRGQVVTFLYRAVKSSGGGETTEPLKITRQPESVTCSSGEVVSFTLKVEGGKAPYTYQWRYTDNGLGFRNIPNNVAFKVYDQGTLEVTVDEDIFASYRGFKCTVTDADGNTVETNVVTITEDATPMVITTQPVNVSGDIGDTAEFTVAVEGGTAPYTYQWQYSSRDDVSDSDFMFISDLDADGWVSGHTTDKLCVTVDTWELTEYYCYRCVITDADGETVKSDVVRVIGPFSVADPTVDASEDPDVFTIWTAPKGGIYGFTYQWQVKADGQSIPADLSDSDSFVVEGAEDSALVVDLTGCWDENMQFRCVVTDGAGTVKETGWAAPGQPLTITREPSNYVCSAGDSVLFMTQVTGGTEPYTYQWQCKWDGESEYQDITVDQSANYAGWNTDKLQFTAAAADFTYNYTYRCVITDANGNTVTTRDASLILDEAGPLLISSHPTDTAADIGEAAVFSVAVTGGAEPYLYTWQVAEHGYDVFTNLAGNIHVDSEGFSSPNLTVQVNAATYGYDFRCVITDADGSEVVTKKVHVTAPDDVPLTISYEPNSAIGVVGETVEFAVYCDGGARPYSYQWYWKNDDMSGFEAITDSVPGMSDFNTESLLVKVNESHAGMGLQFYCVITDWSGNSVTSKTVALNADYEDMTIKTQPKTHGITVGMPAYLSVEVEGGMPPYEYQWCYDKGNGDSAEFSPADVTSGWVRAWNSNQLTVLTAKDNYQNRIGTDVDYFCVITDAMGHTISSAPANLTQSTLFIVKQPESVLCNLSETHTFTVLCNGGLAPYEYQWQYKRDTEPDSAWVNLGKSHQIWAKNPTTDTLTLNMATIGADWYNNGYVFRCVITDGVTTKYTDEVKLELIDDLVVTDTRGGFASMNDEAEFTVEVDGGRHPYLYNWQWNTPQGVLTNADWGEFTTAQSWALNTDYKTAATSHTAYLTRTSYSNGLVFRCEITDADGNTVTTDVLRWAFPLTIQQQPANTVLRNGNGTFTVSATGGRGDYYYQWQYRNDEMALGEFVNLGTGNHQDWCGGWHTDTLTIAGLSEEELAKNYDFRCEIIDDAGNIVYSNWAAGKQLTPLTVAKQPESAMVEVGEDYTVSVNGQGGSGKYTYTWQYMSIRTGVNNYMPLTDVDWAEVDGRKLTVTPTDNQWYNQGYQFRCCISDGWDTYITDAFALNQALTIVTDLKNQTVALGETATFYIAAAGGNPIPFGDTGEYTFEWQRAPKSNPDNWRADIIAMRWDYAVSYQMAISQVEAEDYDYLYRCTVTDADGTVVVSNVVTLTQP